MGAVAVLFDESHNEAWTIRPDVAERMQPAHPADASYAHAADALREREFTVGAHTEGALDADVLGRCDLVVIAHPSDPAWERTTGCGSPRLEPAEIDALEAYVSGGGGLIVLAETEQDKYGNNLNELLDRFGLRVENDTVQDYEHCLGAPSWVLAELGEATRGTRGDPLAGVGSVCVYRAGTLSSVNGAGLLARTHTTASAPGKPLMLAAEHGAGRVVLAADSDLFGDDCLDELDHRKLWLNLCSWTARRERHAGDAVADRPGTAQGHPAWARLRDECNALAALQAPDGSLDDEADSAPAGGHVEQMIEAVQALAPLFPHQAVHLEATMEDLRAWQRGGYAKPDFTRSLAAFRPERERHDGIEHLVLFPMYKQNGSRDTCFEALIVRVPWPDWVAELERDGRAGAKFDNPKFVPVTLADATRGYDSECAVLFPEMVSVGGPPARPEANFGAIFCDREAERLRRVAGDAADLLALNLPPDAARMLASPEISEHAYIVWDLIHDRAHSHGELPFDPFMIRQRSPYWMYSLEELRCDLTAYTQAQQLESDGVPFARYAQYAILLDRLLRFPITGTRVRNYDGLGGQLLFAHLHKHGHVLWADNELTIDWQRVGEGVQSLRERIEMLYRDGIDRSKLAHWAAAHDLISECVPPASGSRWAAAARDLPHVEDPRQYVDLVLEDEFPLSIFYAALKAKLAPV
jgi:hypothetical protein